MSMSVSTRVALVLVLVMFVTLALVANGVHAADEAQVCTSADGTCRQDEVDGGGKTMKAAVFKKYGIEHAKVAEMPKPTPEKEQILIEVHSTSVTTGDWRAADMHVPRGLGWVMRLMFGLAAPRNPIFGQEFAGMVKEVGAAAGSEFKVGDAVFGTNDVRMGAHAEYLAVEADFAVARMPRNRDGGDEMSEYGALAFGGLTSLYFLRDLAQLKEGDRIAITGASGCLGSYGIQLAKHYGAHVTAICSGKNERLVRDLGADAFVDYTKADVTEGDEKYDFIYDTVGKVAFADAKKILTENGQLLTAVFESLGALGKILGNSIFGGKQKYRTGTVPVGHDSKKDLQFLSQLMEEGKLTVAIGETFALDEIAEAFALVNSGHKRGNCVVTVR